MSDPVADLHRALEGSHMPINQIVVGAWTWLRWNVSAACGLPGPWPMVSYLPPYAAQSALRGLYAMAARSERGWAPSFTEIARVACRPFESADEMVERWIDATEACFRFR